MITRSFDATGQARHDLHRFDRASLRSRQPAEQFRLTVLTANVADVVASAGGWLYDRAVMGWDIAVAAAECPDDRPIRILGARVIDFDQALAKNALVGSPNAVAVSVELYEKDAHVRRYSQKEIAGRQTEVALWGSNWPTELSRLCPVDHHLSAAARAFKTHAVAAAGEATDWPRLTETFRVCEHHLNPMGGTRDLVPTAGRSQVVRPAQQRSS